MRRPPAPAFDVCLLHTGADSAAVDALRAQLAARGFTVAPDPGKTPPPLEQRCRAARSILVVTGSDGAGPWEKPAVLAALRRAAGDATTAQPVIPILLAGAARPQLPPLVCNRAWIDFDDSAPGAALDCLVAGITGRSRPRRARSESARPTVPDNRLAFPGGGAATAPPDHEPPPLLLEEILPGAWQVRIQTPFALGTLQAVFTPQGSFRGELLTPIGRNIVDGRWQAGTAARRITLEGRQAAGLQVMPYRAHLQVTFFDHRQIVGTTTSGEQMTWHKETPAA